MDLPFTPAEFFAVFARYNQSVWPLQMVLLGSALVAAWLMALRGTRGAQAALTILALLWIWMGAVYHGWFFRTINPAAAAFMVVFLLARVLRRPQSGERCVVAGWASGRDGRKLHGGTAIFDAVGNLMASSSAIWVERKL